MRALAGVVALGAGGAVPVVGLPVEEFAAAAMQTVAAPVAAVAPVAVVVPVAAFAPVVVVAPVAAFAPVAVAESGGAAMTEPPLLGALRAHA